MKGSLNTMNYLKPYGFINRLKAIFKKRHTADIKTQYEIYRIRTFDFHIDFTKNEKAYFKYDGIPYETFSVYEHLNYLNRKGNTQVRLVFEGTNDKKFHEYCSLVEKLYKDIRFFGGYREKDLKIIYKFDNAPIISDITWYKQLN